MKFRVRKPAATTSNRVGQSGLVVMPPVFVSVDFGDRHAVRGATFVQEPAQAAILAELLVRREPRERHPGCHRALDGHVETAGRAVLIAARVVVRNADTADVPAERIAPCLTTCLAVGQS
ncbi:hypothetical protein [Streptomyces sp. bgisy100]|uniref:hypothetical protein n=1 Tax=Streptomyces sp. bgisy100 TaxID=3413783 RepID=UPI003D7304D7